MRIFRTKPSVDTEASETTIGQENSHSEIIRKSSRAKRPARIRFHDRVAIIAMHKIPRVIVTTRVAMPDGSGCHIQFSEGILRAWVCFKDIGENSGLIRKKCQFVARMMERVLQFVGGS